jgi:hypothetical protein
MLFTIKLVSLDSSTTKNYQDIFEKKQIIGSVYTEILLGSILQYWVCFLQY